MNIANFHFGFPITAINKQDNVCRRHGFIV